MAAVSLISYLKQREICNAIFFLLGANLCQKKVSNLFLHDVLLIKECEGSCRLATLQVSSMKL